MDTIFEPTIAQVLSALDRAAAWQLECAALDSLTVSQCLRLTGEQDIFQLPPRVVEQDLLRVA